MFLHVSLNRNGVDFEHVWTNIFHVQLCHILDRELSYSFALSVWGSLGNDMFRVCRHGSAPFPFYKIYNGVWSRGSSPAFVCHKICIDAKNNSDESAYFIKTIYSLFLRMHGACRRCPPVDNNRTENKYAYNTKFSINSDFDELSST